MERRKFIRVIGLTTVITITGSVLWYKFDNSKPNSYPLIYEFLPDQDLNYILDNRNSNNSINKINWSEYDREDIVSMVKNDFSTDNIEIIGGWVISKTEIEILVTLNETF